MTVLMIVMIVMVIMMLVMVMYIAPFGVCGRWDIFLIYRSPIIKTSLCILSIYSQLFRCIITSSITSISAMVITTRTHVLKNSILKVSADIFVFFRRGNKIGNKTKADLFRLWKYLQGLNTSGSGCSSCVKYIEIHQEIHWSAMKYIEMHWFTLKWPRNTNVHIARIVLWEILC